MQGGLSEGRVLYYIAIYTQKNECLLETRLSSLVNKRFVTQPEKYIIVDNMQSNISISSQQPNNLLTWLKTPINTFWKSLGINVLTRNGSDNNSSFKIWLAAKDRWQQKFSSRSRTQCQLMAVFIWLVQMLGQCKGGGVWQSSKFRK